jgi:hypothetical protein
MIDSELMNVIVFTKHLPYDFVFKKLLKHLRPDGFAVLKEYIRGKNVLMHSMDVWNLLHEDDRAVLLSFQKEYAKIKWKWVLVPEEKKR